MHRVKFNDYAELLSDDLNNNNAYLYNGLITTIADFIAANDCVSGLEVTAQAVPDMTVYVKAGRIYQDGYQGFLEADLTTPLTIAPASANQPRIDLICAKYEEVEDEPEIRNVMTDVVSRNITQVEVKTRIASSIAFQVVGGTAAAEPTVPTTPEGWVALAKVTIPANTSVIQQSNIVDMRPKIINIYQHDHSGGANGAKLDYNNLENLPDLSVFKGATTSNNGTKGMVPAPAKGNNNRYLKSDATWGEIDTMQGATSSAAGAAGLVPAPPQNSQNKALLGNGTFGNVVQSVNGQTGTVTLEFIENLNTQNLSSTQKDFNNYTEAGAYYFIYQTYSNSPSGSTAINGFLLVEGQGGSSGYYLQTFYEAGAAGNQNVNIYFRKCIGGTWTPWKQLRFVIESSTSGTTWYRVYNDGWVEQGGIINSVGNETRTITLPKPMANTNYYCACTVKGVADTGTYSLPMMSMQSVSTTQASVTLRADNNNQNVFWQVIGQGA